MGKVSSLNGFNISLVGCSPVLQLLFHIQLSTGMYNKLIIHKIEFGMPLSLISSVIRIYFPEIQRFLFYYNKSLHLCF